MTKITYTFNFEILGTGMGFVCGGGQCRGVTPANPTSELSCSCANLVILGLKRPRKTGVRNLVKQTPRHIAGGTLRI